RLLGFVFFFFQAEDGIRDFHVTGVQTCALPICGGLWDGTAYGEIAPGVGVWARAPLNSTFIATGIPTTAATADADVEITASSPEIGRASCRDRGYVLCAPGPLDKQSEATWRTSG